MFCLKFYQIRKKFPTKEKRGGRWPEGKKQNKTIFKPHQRAFHYDMSFIYKTRKKCPNTP